MIEQIKLALEKATQGKWEAKKGAGWFVKLGDTDKVALVERPAVVGMKLEEADTHLIANAPEWLRYLISEVDRLNKECDMQVDCSYRYHSQVGKLQKAIQQTIDIYQNSDSTSPFGDAIEILEQALESSKQP